METARTFQNIWVFQKKYTTISEGFYQSPNSFFEIAHFVNKPLYHAFS